jgi:ParB family transcriptional regulator, chromosome partitioning protein
VPPKRRGFFAEAPRPEDEVARQREVEALIAPRRSVAQELPIERILPNPFQARRTFDGLDELAEAIRAHGFTSRLRVRPAPTRDGFFQLVYGERRLRAAKQAGLTEIPCEIANHTDEELIEIGLAENIQRRDLDPLEEAQAFRTLIDEQGYSIRRLAERIGKDKSYVEDRLKVLQIPEDVQQMVVERPDSLRAAREIAKLASLEERQPLIEGVIAGQLNTTEVRTIVNTITEAPLQHSTPHARRQAERSAGDTDVQRALEHDIRTIRAIFGRWQHLLIRGETEHGLVSHALTQLLLEAQQLTETLQSDVSVHTDM